MTDIQSCTCMGLHDVSQFKRWAYFSFIFAQDSIHVHVHVLGTKKTKQKKTTKKKQCHG